MDLWVWQHYAHLLTLCLFSCFINVELFYINVVILICRSCCFTIKYKKNVLLCTEINMDIKEDINYEFKKEIKTNIWTEEKLICRMFLTNFLKYQWRSIFLAIIIHGYCFSYYIYSSINNIIIIGSLASPSFMRVNWKTFLTIITSGIELYHWNFL